MKNEFIIGFLSIMFVLNLTWWYGQQYQLQTLAGTNQGINSQTNTLPPPTNGQAVPIETLNNDVVATHNVSKDCWITIGGFVYDVSGYLNLHPGGASRITPYCGQEATQAFQTRGGGGTHSTNAYSILDNYRIGIVNSSVTTQQIQNVEQAPTPAAAQRGNDDDDGDDD